MIKVYNVYCDFGSKPVGFVRRACQRRAASRHASQTRASAGQHHLRLYSTRRNRRKSSMAWFTSMFMFWLAGS